MVANFVILKVVLRLMSFRFFQYGFRCIQVWIGYRQFRDLPSWFSSHRVLPRREQIGLLLAKFQE